MSIVQPEARSPQTPGAIVRYRANSNNGRAPSGMEGRIFKVPEPQKEEGLIGRRNFGNITVVALENPEIAFTTDPSNLELVPENEVPQGKNGPLH